MLKNKKFWMFFIISFAATAAVTAFLLLVVFRGMFFNIYKAKGNEKLKQGYALEAAQHFESAVSWKPKKQEGYILVASAYAQAEDFDSAGAVIDEAIKKKITSKDSGLEQLYIARVKIYSASGKLLDAANYIDSLSDQYIRKKIESKRPADLTYTPMQGSYDKTLKMTINVREGETVYYTTDGSYPTKFSNIYVEPINISNGTTRITAVSVNSDGLVSPMLSVAYTVKNDYQEVAFDDPKMEKMVRQALNKPAGNILIKELEAITELTNDGVEGSLRTLSDLDLMPNLKTLYLQGETKLVSLSQLSGKASLTELILAGCELDNTDITALGSLASLKSLDLSDNNITSVSVLSNLSQIEYIYLTNNVIEDLSPLSQIKTLKAIEASDNRIVSVPELSPSLESLYLHNNSISDISSIHTLEGLKQLDLSLNALKDAKNVGKLKTLETLILSGNNITNFDFLQSLENLSMLDVSNTSFVSIKPISRLPIVTLYANGTGLGSLSGVSDIKTLVSLNISNTSVSDIEPLTSLEKLDYLDISDCEIKDAKPLTKIKNLYTLIAKNVDLSKVKFKNSDMTVVK